jgi:EAL domain-containing protein (putative c-di-GMP-specific phosphodiesterase class I)
VIAEGVETNEVLELLREYRCDAAQGYLYATPLTEPEFIEKMNQRKS